MRFSPPTTAWWFKVILGLALLGLGFLGGWFIHSSSKPVTVTPIRDSNTGYNLIDPTLYTVVPQTFSYPTYTPLKNALTSYITTAEHDKEATYISLYYEDFNSAEWVGVNPTEKYDPASMLKVATLIALLHASETNPGLLSESISIPATTTIPDSSDEAYFPAANPIKSGNTYTVSDLMNRLIVQSDDGADDVLVNLLGDNVLTAVFTDLHIPLPGSTTGVSPQEYSHLFRVLYNGTYLTRADSQTALALLTRTTYTAGLVAGVPSGTLVAHKFGESLFPPISEKTTWPQTSPTASDVPGLSDCGIVYYPNHPYFLCVMTQGTDFNTLASVIQNLSEITWNQVTALYSK